MSLISKLASREHKLTKELMKECLDSPDSHPKKWFVANKTIHVQNRMQNAYSYTLQFKAGTKLTHGGYIDGEKILYPDFKPKYSPGKILQMGAFEGKYCNDQIFEFPSEWYSNMKRLSPERANANINYFGIKSRQSLQEWKRKKWIPCAKGDQDTRGWFEWYCRYWLGRRHPDVDVVQIKRWKSFTRHYAQYLKNTKGKGKEIHPRRRQALLQWSYPCVD
jgi:hypothetical protein